MNRALIDNFTLHHGDISLHLHHHQISPPWDLRFFLVRIFYPCLLIWGTIGNALCLRVLLSKKFYKNSTCQYLAILAVIDILFILMRSSKHIYKLFRDTTIFNRSKWICRILTFSSSALAHMASWILVIVSFDRYVIVTSRYRRHSTPVNRVFWSTSILIAVVALCNLYYFFILGRTMTLGGFPPQYQRHLLLRMLPLSNETSLGYLNNSMNYFPLDILRYKPTRIFVCIPSPGFGSFFRTYIPIFDILLVAAIPCVLLCFTNIGIILFTMRINRRMRQHRKRSHRRHQRLTIMLLSVTLAFIGLTCPSVIFICVNKIIYSGRILTEATGNLTENVNLDQRANVQLLVDVCEALWYTKHAMNFILYTLSGQDFRREFVKLITHCCNLRSFLLRKVLNKPQTTATTTMLPIESTFDLQLYVPNTHKKMCHRKRSKKSPVCDIDNISNTVFIHSNPIQLESAVEHQRI